MTVYTNEQKIGHLKKWVTSGQLLKDYCYEEGVSISAMRRWSLDILGSNYTSTLRSTEQKAVLLKKIEKMESSSPSSECVATKTPALVMVSKAKKNRSKTHSIFIEYMGARISIDENSIESVFRALKAVND